MPRQGLWVEYGQRLLFRVCFLRIVSPNTYGRSDACLESRVPTKSAPFSDTSTWTPHISRGIPVVIPVSVSVSCLNC